MVSRKTKRGTRAQPARAACMFLEHLESRVLLSALPVVSLSTGKSKATELNGTTTGAGTFVLTRTGSLAGTLTVAYAVDIASTALNGVDYNVGTPLTGVISFAIGASKATL